MGLNDPQTLLGSASGSIFVDDHSGTAIDELSPLGRIVKSIRVVNPSYIIGAFAISPAGV